MDCGICCCVLRRRKIGDEEATVYGDLKECDVEVLKRRDVGADEGETRARTLKLKKIRLPASELWELQGLRMLRLRPSNFAPPAPLF